MTKFLEPLLQPIGFFWLLTVIAAVRLAYQRKWRGAIFCSAIVAAIFLIGSTTLPSRLLASLERPYAGQRLENLPACDAVVMLGGLLNPSRHDLLGFDVGSAADRALTAIELLRRGKAGTLVLGGGGGLRKVPEGAAWRETELLEPWLSAWNLTASKPISIRLSANTREEAQQVLDLAREHRWQRILLVTSGYHMKRAEALFRQSAVSIVPVACDFVGLSTLETDKPFTPFPEIYGFQYLTLYIHEQIGWLYYRLRGWVTENPQS